MGALNRWGIAGLLVALLLNASAFADLSDDARALKEEALRILKANADRDGATDEIAKCIFDLEKAQGLLETANDTSSDLATEVNSQLYWARKRSTLAIDAALDKLRGAPAKKTEIAQPAAKSDADDPLAGATVAKKAFVEAETAASHARDDYVVAVNWFQMAALHPGTDFALKALTFARNAQERFASQSASASNKKEVIPDTEEMKPLKDADALVALTKYEEAIPLYQASLKIKETIIGHRHLALAYYNRAQQYKDNVMSKFDKIETAYYQARKSALVTRFNRTYLNDKDPVYKNALKKHNEVMKEVSISFSYFDKAQSDFKAVLRMSPDEKDLDAAGHLGICMSQPADPYARSRAKIYLVKFLADYKPANDIERSLYEFCRAQLTQLAH